MLFKESLIVHAVEVTHVHQTANVNEITQDGDKPSQKHQPCDYRVGALDHLQWVQLPDSREGNGWDTEFNHRHSNIYI